MIEKIKVIKSNAGCLDAESGFEIADKLNEVINVVNGIEEKTPTQNEKVDCTEIRSGILANTINVHLFKVSANTKAILFCGEDEDLKKYLCNMSAMPFLKRWFSNGL